ncbi:MAG: WYL domain-containing protein, partial [Acidimicrobiia bacterium]|nr:WYL domain-containing protein [Acidimicrobiia bacterium]
ILLADYFSRPLRLTPGQGLALLAASEALLSVPGTDPDGALARALDKLAQAVGVGGTDPVDIRLGVAEDSTLDQLRAAAAAGSEVEIVYYSYNRDATTAREIAPWRVFADSGNWYVHGWCHVAEGERVFRVDRVEKLTPLDRPARVQAAESEREHVFLSTVETPRVTLLLDPEAAWVVDAYPTENVVEKSAGRLQVTLAVSEIPWLERLLIRLGPQAQMVHSVGIDNAGTLAVAAAERIVKRYQLN